MLTGETITSIVNAEPAGFILTFSHGRVAHLSLRDQLGRPTVTVQFLRKAPSGSQNGIFGSIRNVFSGSGRRNVAAAHAGKASRGQRYVLVVTGDAELELWDTRMNVGDSLKFQLNAKEELLDSLKHNMPPDGHSNYHFSVLDFAFSSPSRTQEIARTNGESSDEVSFLVALSHGDRSYYYIVDTTIFSEAIKVNTVYPVTCYKQVTRIDAAWQPKLVVPQPGRTAFIVFESAIVLYSLAKLEESPSSQLLLEGGNAPQPFQDCIRFQEDTPFHVLTTTPEDQDDDHKHPSVVIAVQSFGLVRISATYDQTSLEDVDEVKVTPKSKIEQAVFFGSLKNNPLDLFSQGEQQFQPEDIEAAALEVSLEILTSSSKYLPKVTPSIEQNLRSRVKAHDDLALHMAKNYNPLSRSARFQLLWNAEKLAAQRALWKVEEEHRKRRPEGEETIFQLFLYYIHPNKWTAIDRSKGENDRVRKWMTFDADKINVITPWFYGIHDELYKDEVTDPKPRSENILETIEILEAIYDTVYKFRANNASAYGLGNETFSAGVLKSDYAGLPLVWTAKDWRAIYQFVEFTSRFAREWWVTEGKPSTGLPDPATIRKIGGSLKKQVELLSRMMMEQSKWYDSQDTENSPRKRDEILLEHRRISRELMLSMAGLGFSDEAVRLAEEFADMDILVELNIDALVQLNDQSDGNAREVEHLQREARRVNERMDKYFSSYKDRWAKAYYEKMIQDGHLGSLLDDGTHQENLTRYLRKNPAYGKLSWINDIVGEKSFSQASETLAAVAESQETDLWSKKVELCLSKLATLAAVETEAKAKKSTNPIPTDQQAAHIAATTASISLLELQRRLYIHVTSLIGRNILDVPSRHELAFEILGKNSLAVKDKTAFKGLLYDSLGLLLNQQSMTIDQIIDVLTLMSPIGSDPIHQDKITEETLDAGIIGLEFIFALNAIDFALPNNPEDVNALEKRTKREALQTLVWRRVMLRDNWQDLNNTANKSDQAVTDSMKDSILGFTVYNVLMGAQEDNPSADYVKPTIPTPESIRSADPFPKILQNRFSPQELDLVAKDLELECEELSQAIEKGRLGVWFPAILAEMERDVITEMGGDIEDEIQGKNEGPTQAREAADTHDAPAPKNHGDDSTATKGSGDDVEMKEVEVDHHAKGESGNAATDGSQVKKSKSSSRKKEHQAAAAAAPPAPDHDNENKENEATADAEAEEEKPRRRSVRFKQHSK